MKGWMVLATFTAVSVFVSTRSPAEPTAKSGLTDKSKVADVVRSILDAHNRERAEAKLSSLSLDPKLTAAAQAHADDMAAHRKMTHDGSDGSSPSDRIKRQDYRYQNDGENVAEGYQTVDDLMRGWMESEPHRKNILGKFSQAGIALAHDEEGVPYWCVDFATPWPKLDPAQAADDLVKAINKERASADLPPLKARVKLGTAASRIAKEYATADTLDFKARSEDLLTILRRLGYRYRKLAESAASGQPGPAEVVKTWMDSKAHSEHVLGDFTEIGVGYSEARSGTPYWCIVLARPLNN